MLASDAADRAALSAEALGLERDGCALWTGGHPDEAFAGAELVVVSPGVPLTLPALVRVRARGVPIVGELELAWRAMEADVIAITGTNGKTTTTALTGELLRAQVRPVLVGGNIGTPLSEHALDFPADGIVVAESSSFQLESTALFRPRVAAVLNITPDHLDRHGSFERYVEAKARILANQTEADCAVLNADDPGAAALAARVRGRVLWFSRLRQDDPRRLRRRGLDRRAAQRARRAHLPGDGRRAARRPQRRERARGDRLRAVDGDGARGHPAGHRRVSRRRPPDRARPRRTRGVAYYNDSKGTNVDSTIKALESFTEPVVLIAGGKGKGQDFAPARPGGARARAPRRPDRGGPRAAPRSARRGRAPSSRTPRSMEAAVLAARAAARPGDVVLLSPACASFDMFDNFEHRGDVFKAAVMRLSRLMPRKLTPDLWLFALVVVLVSVGVVMVYSASAIVAAERFHDPFFFLKKQLFWAVAGFGCLWMAMRLDYRRLERVVTPLLVVSFVLLVLVLVPPFGQEINGTRRWFRSGPVSFQPVELAKFALVLYLASFLTRRQEVVKSFSQGLLPLLMIAGLMAGLTVIQPDLGNSLALIILTLALAYLAGARPLHMGAIAAAALPVVVVLVAMKPYRWRRMVAFMNPWDDPQGSGFQIIQSFLALGSGGWLGLGLGESKQKLFYLPEPYTDFIFAIIGEELGLVGAVARGRALRAAHLARPAHRAAGAGCLRQLPGARAHDHAGDPDPREPRRRHGRPAHQGPAAALHLLRRLGAAHDHVLGGRPAQHLPARGATGAEPCSRNTSRSTSWASAASA